MIQFAAKKPLSDLKLRVSDAGGKLVREIAVPARRSQPGIQAVCWDLRFEPIPAPDTAAAGGGGRGGRGGGGRGATSPAVPGVPGPETAAGYLPMNPCAPDSTAASGRGGGGGGFGGAAGPSPAPHVVPGTYTVALVAGGKTLDTKPLRVIMDPEVRLADAQHQRYNEILMGLHDLQRRGTQTASMLNALYPQITDIAKKVDSNAAIPAPAKAEFAAFNKQFDSLRVKFGVPLGAAAGGRGGGGGGGGGRGGADPQNALARTATVKTQIMAIWEPPSPASVKQSSEARAALTKAIADANTFLAKARSMSESLKKYDITLTVPPAAK